MHAIAPTPDVLLALEDRIRALLTDRGEMTLASIVQELHAHGDWRQIGVTMLAMRDRGEIDAAWLGVVPLTVFRLRQGAAMASEAVGSHPGASPA